MTDLPPGVTPHGPPLFTEEGPKWYSAAYAHNSAFSHPNLKGMYNTELEVTDEEDFQHWVIENQVPFDLSADLWDYDMRWYWLDNVKGTGVGFGGGHFPDTYKTPFDTSFSAESRYATPNCPFEWMVWNNKDILVDMRDGQIIFDSSYEDPGKILPPKAPGPNPPTHARLPSSSLVKPPSDLDLAKLNLALKGFHNENIVECVTEGEIEQTIEGASTLTFRLLDYERILQDSPFLGKGVISEVDGLYFSLVGVGKEEDIFSLTFEDREVYYLRQYNSYLAAAWGTTTRAEFIRSMVKEVKEIRIPFVCPELDDTITPGDMSRGSLTDDQQRRSGWSFSARVTSKNAPADQGQRAIIALIINIGLQRGARRKVIVCAMMTATQESNNRNLEGGDRDSAGVFQQRPSQGWGTYEQVTDPVYATNKFYDKAIPYDSEHPLAEYTVVCQAVQSSNYPDAYAAWRTEAEHNLTEFGIVGSDKQDSSGASNNQKSQTPYSNWTPASVGAGNEQQFRRGQMTTDASGKKTVKKEDSWEASLRLADEVAWRRFIVAGKFYYASEPYLFKSKPQYVIKSEFDGPVLTVNYNYDIGKKNAVVTVTVFLERWSAPPGTVVEIQKMGIINGRWLVATISRKFGSPVATVTLKKPRPVLAEPKQSTGGSVWTGPSDGKKVKVPPGVKFVAAFPTGSKWGPDIIISTPEDHASRSGVASQPGWESDDAIDWQGTPETPVVAVESGTIGKVYLGRVDLHTGGRFGAQIHFNGNSGITWFYTHIHNIPSSIKSGARLKPGSLIGFVTRWDDHPPDSHLHLGSTDIETLRALTYAPQVTIS